MAGESKCYELIAIHAARQAGMDLPDAAAVAALGDVQRRALLPAIVDNPAAVALRDEIIREFERRCRDISLTGEQVLAWFCQAITPVSRIAVYRARASLRAEESRISDTAAQAQAYVDLAAAEGADSVFAGAATRAGQLIFQLLYQIKSEDLETKDPAKVAKILTSLAQLMKSRADTALADQKLREAQTRLDAAKAHADELAERELKGSGVDADTIARIRTIYGLPPVAGGAAA